jgi:NitT/TauT family transport system substrate-binding protein
MTLSAVALLAFLVVTGGPAPSQETVTLRLSASPLDGVVPILYAQRAGLFRQAGINITLDKVGNGAVMAAAVVGGSVDIAKGNIMSIVTAHARNIPLTIVAAGPIYDPKTPDAVLLAATDSTIRGPSDLIGKTVGVPSLNDLSSIAIQAWMDAAKADWHKVQFVEVGYPAMLPALEQGRVQAIVQVKPFITEIVNSGKAKVVGLIYSAVSNRFLESAWFARTDFVATHRDVITKFQQINAQASAYVNSHQPETADLLAAWAGLDPERAAHIPRIVTGTTLQAREVQPVIDMAAKYGLIPKTFDAREILAL